MKRFVLLGGIGLCIYFFISACAVGMGPKFPESSAGFQPKKEYKVSYDGMWAVVKKALEKERINIASSSKEEGLILTDYVQGPDYLQVVPSIAYNTRYKYSITVTKMDEGTTRVGVVCTLELKSSDLQAWRDISKSKKDEAMKLESWLCERIEKSL